MESCRLTEDEIKSKDSAKTKLREMEIEYETGIPQFPDWVPPSADQMFPEGGE